MRKPFRVETNPVTVVSSPTGTLTVLYVSPFDEDHLSLQAIVGHSTWRLFKARDLVSALALLQQHDDIAVVLCECNLLPGTWIDLLENINALPSVPSLVVTSRLADERLWSEALNRGASDVLAKPFDRSEVIRRVRLAWQHWHHQPEALATSMRVMTAAS
jgi:DNA-binding response OmpR family regulator